MVDEATVYTFDRAGRLSTAVIDERTYRRGLTNRVLCKWHEGPPGSRVIRRRWLSADEARQLVGSVIADVEEALSALKRRQFDAAEPSDQPQLVDKLCPWLEQAAEFDFEALAEDAERANRIYRPVAILPPDQYLALVLQATEGCHFNRCSFCSFYRDRPFRIKPLHEFREHLSEVLEFLGAGVTLRRSVFLADANAVCIPRDELLPLLDFVNENLPIKSQAAGVSASGPCLDGIYSFVDAFSDRSGPERDYAEMKTRNVRRLYLGIETGCLDLLRFLRKPQAPRDVRQTVLAMKGAGLSVGAILMLGIGGKQFAERHAEESISLLNALPWSPGDLIFLSQYVDFPGAEYPELARRAGIEPLSEDQLKQQYATIRGGISRVAGHPKIAPYNAEEFTY